MKTLAALLILLSFSAYADDAEHGEVRDNPNPLIGGNSGSTNTRSVPSAIAPSVNTSIICPMVMQGSKAGSVFFFSGSGTHQPDIVPLCVAWHLKQFSVVEKMTCSASKEYAAANPACKSEKTPNVVDK